MIRETLRQIIAFWLASVICYLFGRSVLGQGLKSGNRYLATADVKFLLHLVLNKSESAENYFRTVANILVQWRFPARTEVYRHFFERYREIDFDNF